MKIILPAAGKASRVSGIPKFLLPVVDTESKSSPVPLINWHLKKLQKYQNEILIPTSSVYFEIIKAVTESFKPTVIQIDSQSMPDSIIQVCNRTYSEKYMVIMPDTYFSSYEFADHLNLQLTGLALATWRYREEQFGRFGSVEVDLERSQILSVVDKDSTCKLESFWGAISLKREFLQYIERDDSHLGLAFNRYRAANNTINLVLANGDYFDLGTFQEYFSLVKGFES